jgi:hypothetical protein
MRTTESVGGRSQLCEIYFFIDGCRPDVILEDKAHDHILDFFWQRTPIVPWLQVRVHV